MDDAVLSYIDGIEPGHRPLFDRVHDLILAAHPDVVISVYGWPQGRDGGFTDRHPELRTSKGTIRLRPEDAAAMGDDELLGLINAALDA